MRLMISSSLVMWMDLLNRPKPDISGIGLCLGGSLADRSGASLFESFLIGEPAQVSDPDESV